jgi:hypothetical protein
MSVGPLGGIAGSVAGSPLAQTKGSEVERAQQDSAAQQRQVEGQVKAESAAGIGETDGKDHETAERDADGRLPWRFPAKTPAAGETAAAETPQSKDPSGQSGSLLDVSG